MFLWDVRRIGGSLGKKLIIEITIGRKGKAEEKVKFTIFFIFYLLCNENWKYTFGRTKQVTHVHKVSLKSIKVSMRY